MANSEMQLVSRIIHTGELHVALEWGLTESDFRTSEGKGLWNAILAYYSNPETALAVVGPRLFKNMFPHVPLMADPTVPTLALCYEVRKSRVEAEAKAAAMELHEQVEIDPQEAIDQMHSTMSRLISLGTTKNTDLSLSASLGSTMQRYQYIKVNGQSANAKLLWPWPELDDVTGGIQKDDYIVLYGRPKSMKTWALSAILGAAFHQRKKVLIYTKEMTQDNILMRAAACAAEVPYQEFRTGKLDHDEERRLYTLIDMARDEGFDPICLNGRAAKGGDTTAWIHAKVEKYKPDIVFIDGMYLLSIGSGKKVANWEKVTEISRGIREMILATDTPAVCTMQANRGAAKNASANLDEIAYADAVAQDATAAIRVINEKAIQPHIGVTTIAMLFGGSREFALHGIRIGATPATDFRFKEIMTERDILKASEGDVGDAEAEDPKAHSKPRVVRKPKTAPGPGENALITEQLKNNLYPTS